MNRNWSIALLLSGVALSAAAGATPDEKLPLDKLLETPISTAAKYDQQLSSVAASVTVITSEEIERYGWTTVDEVLGALRSFYTTYDRSYVYAGVRGPLVAEDIADCVAWTVTRPWHVNIDLMVVRPRAQAAQHKVFREDAS